MTAVLRVLSRLMRFSIERGIVHATLELVNSTVICVRQF